MSIRRKLILSYAAMVVVPVILFGLAIMLLGHAFIKDALPGSSGSSSNGGKRAEHALPLASIRDLFTARSELSSGLRFIAGHDPKLLGDPAFLASMEAELEQGNSGIVVTRNDKLTYASPGLAIEDIPANIRNGKSETSRFGPPAGEQWVAFSFENADGGNGTLYLMTDMKPVAKLFKKLFPLALLTLLAALAVTNGVLSYLVSRSIIKPLYTLREAAGRIREGDLDHPVKLRRQDEIGQLGATFEEMRVRLKGSIDAQLQLEQSRRELLANISHDLKTPITAIQGCAECLRDGIAYTEEQRQKYVQMITGKTAEMNRMIEELQLYATLDTGKLPYRMEKVDLTDYVIQLVNELRLDPRLSDVEMTFGADLDAGNEDGGGTLLIQADRQKLYRALMNLVDNSLQHMRTAPKRIRFSLEAEPAGMYVLRMADNGEGIPEEALPRVFDRFFRAEESRTPGQGNSGLGLAIVKQIIEAHGGTAYASGNTGGGATIALRFPPAATYKTDEGGSC